LPPARNLATVELQLSLSVFLEIGEGGKVGEIVKLREIVGH